MAKNYIDIPQNSAQKENLQNQNNEMFNPAANLSKKGSLISGLTWGYNSILWVNDDLTETEVEAGSILLNASTTNYIEFNPSTKLVQKSVNSFTVGCIPMAKVLTGANSITSTLNQDQRRLAFLPYGLPSLLKAGGGSSSSSTGALTVVETSTDRTFSLSDAGKIIRHPSADVTPRIWTIPSNSDVAFLDGTVMTLINKNSAGNITITINGGDTLRFAITGATGNRLLKPNCIATLVKNGATEWLISGAGLE